MKRNDWLTLGGWALGTMVLVLAVGWPHGVTAKDPPGEKLGRVERPLLKTKGCELTLAIPQGLKVGDRPDLTLVATNPTSQTVTLSVNVTMQTMTMADMTSRRGPMPRSSWKCSRQFAVAPGETRQLGLDAPPALSGGQQVTFVLEEDGKSIAIPAGLVAGPAVAAVPAAPLYALQQRWQPSVAPNMPASTPRTVAVPRDVKPQLQDIAVARVVEVPE